jgi:hypothetical protein
MIAAADKAHGMATKESKTTYGETIFIQTGTHFSYKQMVYQDGVMCQSV